MAKGLEKTRFCKLSSKDLEEHGKAYAALVAKPKFVCTKCLRVSASKHNLCQPEKLKKLA